MHHVLSGPSRGLAVRAQVLAQDVMSERVQLRDDGERGAQTAEYAMLGGVGAAACTALIMLLKRQDFIERLLQAIVDVLINSIRQWF